MNIHLLALAVWCSIATLFGVHVSDAREEDPTGAERTAMLYVVHAALMYSDENRGKFPETIYDLEPYIGNLFELPLEKLVFLPSEHRLRPDVLAFLPTDGGVIMGYKAGDVDLIRSVVRPVSKRSNGIISQRNLLIASAAGNVAFLGLLGHRLRKSNQLNHQGQNKSRHGTA